MAPELQVHYAHLYSSLLRSDTEITSDEAATKRIAPGTEPELL
jgi:hypothetical protein